jgi:hypothetical protein
VACKLRALKVDLKRWNEEVLVNVGRRKEDPLGRAFCFDIVE